MSTRAVRRSRSRETESTDHQHPGGRAEAGGILRGRMATRDFTMISNESMRDPRLSYAAKGILANLASHSEGYPITIDMLTAMSKDGRDRVRRGLHELIELGYVTRHERARKGKGRFATYTYEITDIPARCAPQVVVALEPNRAPGSVFPTLVCPKKANQPDKKNKKEKTRQTGAPAPIETPGAHLLRGLRLRSPITEQVVRQHAEAVDELLQFWSFEKLVTHLETESTRPGVRNPLGHLIWAIRAATADRPPHRRSPDVPRRGCTTCESDEHGWISEILTDQRGNEKEVLRRCPDCGPSAS